MKLGEKWGRNDDTGRGENRTEEMRGWEEGKEGEETRIESPVLGMARKGEMVCQKQGEKKMEDGNGQ